MSSQRRLSVLAGAAASVVVPLIARAGTATPGTPTAGTLFFDTFRVQNPIFGTLYHDATVQKVQFSFDGVSTFTLTTPTSVADLGSSGNADGLIFAPNGNLLIGGSTTGKIEEITTAGAVVTSVNVTGTNPYHLTLSPNGSTIYSGGLTSLTQGGDAPGPLGVTPFSPVFSNGASVTLTGSDTSLTQLAFDRSGHAYYTSSPDTGTGSVGGIDLSTHTTTRHISSLPAAHGITYDPFTGDLMVAGATHITQIDPATFSIVSDINVSSLGVTMLDQVYVDGRGHLFAGDNGSVNLFSGTGTMGKLVMVDYSKGSHTLGTASFVGAQSLALALDDIAPLSALLVGDANFDGTVNFADVLTLIQHYGATNASWTVGDFNGDGTVNFGDVLLLIQHYGQSLAGSPAATAVPEPAAMALAAGCGIGVLRRRR